MSEELELTADDLRALSAGSTGDGRKNPAAPGAPPQGAAPKQPDSGERGVPRKILPLGIALALIAVAGGLDQFFRESSADPPAREQWPAPAREEAAVRFANPFDASEVFEFPAGTTEAEAREAVAAFLIERAANRQARVDGKLKRNP